MSFQEYKYLLTIAIPTFNRAEFLLESLTRIANQIRNYENTIEIIVSDNCSTDNTKNIISTIILDGTKIKYLRNSKNIGMDGNFIECVKAAKGKYVWLLGDDDYLLEDSLERILPVLKSNDCGLVHIKTDCNNKNLIVKYCDSLNFILDVSYWITFISSNIVRSKYISKINFNEYYGTLLSMVPLYWTAALSEKKNIIIQKSLFEHGKNIKSNGGYNFFEIFVENYFSIWQKFVDAELFSIKMMNSEKKNFFFNYLIYFIKRLLIRKNVGNFITDNGWSIIHKYYKNCIYFYVYICIVYCHSIIFKK